MSVAQAIKIPRAATMAAIAAWLESSERTFVIVGPPGSGKSVIATMIADTYAPPVDQGPLVVMHACSASDVDSISPRSFIEKTSEALAAWGPFATALHTAERNRGVTISVTMNVGTAGQVTGVSIAHVVIGDIAPEDAFVIAVLNPLKKALAQHSRPVLLAVDGLDESVVRDRGSGIARLISALKSAPREVKVLVTSRPDSELHDAFEEARIWHLDGGLARATVCDELSAFVRAELAHSPVLTSRVVPELGKDRLVALVVDRAIDNFLVARLLIDMLAAEDEPITEQSVQAAPATLHGLYRRNLSRMRQRLGRESWTGERLPILGYLVVAMAPLSEKELSIISGLAPDQIRTALSDLRHFLVTDPDRPPSQRQYAIYHRSFAEFLLDPDAAADDWCSEPDQHARMIRSVRGNPPWAAINWRSTELYLVKYVAVHCAAQGPQALSDLEALMSASFLAAQHDRVGPAFVFRSLRSAITAAAQVGDQALLMRFAWIFASLRDLLARQVSPTTVLLLARLGELDRALRLIDEIEDPIGLVRLTVVQSLARVGRIEDARRVSRLDTGALDRSTAADMAMTLAQALAATDPAAALQIAPTPGLGFLWRRETSLCVDLARRDEFVDRAIERAEHCDEAMIPVALEIGKRDWQRGNELMQRVRTHKIPVDGVQFYRNIVTGVCELAMQLTRAGNPSIALQLLAEQEPEQVTVAAAVMAGELSRAHPELAAACLRLIAASHQPVLRLLAVAHVLASGAASDLASSAEQLMPRTLDLRDYLSPDPDYAREGLDLLRRLPLETIARVPEARRLALLALSDIAASFVEVDFAASENHYFQLGRHWSVLDETAAVAYADGIESSDRRKQFRGGIVTGLAVNEIQQAIAFAEQANLDDYVTSEIVRALARQDVTLALRFVDLFSEHGSERQIWLLTPILEEAGNTSTELLRQLLERIPRYVDTREFARQVRDARVGTARALLSKDRARALEIAGTSLADWDPDRLTLFRITAAGTDRTAALPLIRSLRDPLLRADNLLDFAGADPTLLAQAHQVLDTVPVTLMERKLPIARLFAAYQQCNPLEALKLAIKEGYDADRLTDPVRAFLTDEDGFPLLFKAKALLRFLPESKADDAYADWVADYRRRNQLVNAILSQLDEATQQEFIDLLATHGWDRPILQWRCLLAQEPRRVIDQVSEALEAARTPNTDPDQRQHEISLEVLLNDAIAAVAAKDPQYAASVWRTRGDGSDLARQPLPTLVAALARQDLAAALALAHETGSRADQTLRRAVAHLADDAGLALRVIKAIKDSAWRGRALDQLTAGPSASWSHSEDLTHQLTTLTGEIPFEEKTEVMQAIAATLTDKSAELQTHALCVAALSERRVFLNTIESFAALVADAHNPQMSAMEDGVRTILQAFETT